MEGLKIARICLTNDSYKADRANELSFEKGDLVTLASDLTEDGKHYQAVSADGGMGLIHSSFLLEHNPIPLLPMPWFHSAISRLDAEKLLDRNQDGQFLLRTSQNTKSVYALAVSHGGAINHYLVAMDSTKNRLTLNGTSYYSNLPDLVTSLTMDPGPLGTLLSFPVVRRGALDFYIDQEALKETWGLVRSEVKMGETLGRGEFGEVCMASYRGMQVAAKVILEDKQDASNTLSLLQEAAIMTNLQHTNLVQLVGLVFQESSLKCILMELMGKGSLQKYLISRGRSVISPAELLSFARNVCEGMVYVSSKGFVHRDLAARNVLLNSNGQAKISDFGLARKAELHVPHEGGKFPVKWTAPEALKESKFSVKSDVWSYGVLLWEVYSYGRTPYPSVPTSEVLESIEDGLLMDPPDHCPDEIYDMMCVCWEMDPGQRPSFEVLQRKLARVSEGSHTPTPSPMLPRRHILSLPNAEELVTGPIAAKAYKEAPLNRKATMFLGSVLLLGPQGSGKTSLLRSLKGEPFRLVEPASQKIDITENYCLLTDNLSWIPSTAGLMYEDQLVRIIVEDLHKHVHAMLTKPGPVSLAAAATPPAARGASSSPALPPRRRSQSFTESRRLSPSSDVDSSCNRSTAAAAAATPTSTTSNKFSGSFEMLTSVISKPQVHASPKPRKNILTKFFSKGLRHHHHYHHHSKEQRKVQRHYSDSAKHSYHTETTATTTQSTIATATTTPEFSSPLPERLMEQIKTEYEDSSEGGNLAPRHLARLIDIPGNPSFRVLQNLFLTESSVCVVTFDASRDILSPPPTFPLTSLSLWRKISPLENGGPPSNKSSITYTDENTYLLQIMAEISSVCVQWSGCATDMTICGPRIALVGTHSDKVPSSVTHRNFEILRDEIKASPYHKYVAMGKFVVSNSSIIERSSMDDLKRFLRELIKKSCRQQVPLKWLRCVRRFQGMVKNKTYFMKLTEAKKLVSEICDISLQDPEIAKVISFLHQNQVIIHFSNVHHLRDIIITNALWFIQQVSALFGAGSVDVTSAPLDLTVDQDTLRSTGVLSNQLLDYVWRGKDSRANKNQLLAIMHKMDLLCCMASEHQPLSLSASSMDNLTADAGTLKKNQSRHHHNTATVVVSSVVVPALAIEETPPHFFSLPLYDVDPIKFRFKAHIPHGLFHRLLVRCVQCYSRNFLLCQHAAMFEVDEKTHLLLTEGKDHITLTLHSAQKNTLPNSGEDCGCGSSDGGSDSNSLSEPPPDTCLAILMFIQASMNDLTRNWTPHLEFDFCIECHCRLQPIPMDAVVDIDAAVAEMSSRSVYRRPAAAPTRNEHYIILNDVDNLLQQLSLRCELGNQVPISPSLLCWFGEVPLTSASPSSTTDVDFVTDNDISKVAKALGGSWKELGQTLGFSQLELEKFSTGTHSVIIAGRKMLDEWLTLQSKNATYNALLGALEIIQRQDIVDKLEATRTKNDHY